MAFNPLRLVGLASAAALMLGTTSAHAQRAASLTAADLGLTEAQLQSLLQGSNAPSVAPGIVFGSPTAFGADWGTAGIGIGGATLPKSSDDDYDGSAGFVLGLGDANTFIGVETIVSVVSLKESFGEDGSVAFKAHTNLPGGMAIAVGLENTLRWGEAEQGESSVYIAGSKVLDLDPGSDVLPLAITLGLGDNRFNDPGESGANVFGALALIPHEQFSLIADYAGTGLNLGVSIVPIRAVPLIVSLGFVNVTERNEGDSEFAGGIGYSFSF